MNAAVRAELLKLRTTRTVLVLLAAMTALVLLAVLLHAFGLPKHDLTDKGAQRRVLIAGQSLGVVFAALVGALSPTTELRHGTLRPTLLAQPNRVTVLTSKAITASIVGLGFGLISSAIAVAVATTALHDRALPLLLSGRDDLQLIVGGAGASALWAVMGTGLGSLVRNQVAAIVGIFIWLQIIENLLIDSAPAVSKFMPGALAQALAGSTQGTLRSPLAAAILLVLYTAGIALAGTAQLARTDIT